MEKSWSEKDEIICLALYFRQRNKELSEKDVESISLIVGKPVESVKEKLADFKLMESGNEDIAMASDFCKKVWKDFS